jgi:HlyD family secretion protein
MKRKTIIAAGTAVAVMLALGGGFAYAAVNNQTQVGVTAASTAPLSVTVSASGALTASHSSGVYAPTAGTLAEVLVKDGDTVTAGQVLARMDTTALKLAVSQAKAAHSAALAQSVAVTNLAPSAADRAAASATLAAARSQAATATSNYNDYLSDYNGSTSAEQATMIATLRTLRSAQGSTSAAVKTAQAALSKLSRSSQLSASRTAAAEAITAASQALSQAQSNLKAAVITAPFAGTVSLASTVEAGAGVAPGVAVFTVVDASKMEFLAAVNQTDIAQVAVGQTAAVTLDAFAEPFSGTVTSVQATPQTSTTGSVTFAARIAIEAGSSRLFQGMSGSADIEVQSIAEALVIPVESVLTSGSSKSVFVLGSDGVVHTRKVTIGAATDTLVQIIDGLSVGEQVVTTGASSLADGQRVRTK